MKMFQYSVFVFFMLDCSASLAGSQFKSMQWQLVESNDTVSVFGRGVQDLPNAREIITTIEVPQSPEALLALMVDYPNATNWRQRIKDVTIAKTIDENNWFVNYVTDLPWPLHDRVALLKCEIIHEKNTGAIIYAFESVPSRNGMGKQETLSGQYKFVPQTNGQTKVIYQIMIDSPIKIPDWLVSALIGDSFVTQMEMLRDAVAQPRYTALN